MAAAPIVALDPGDVEVGLFEQPLGGVRQVGQHGFRLLLADRVGVVGLDLADLVQRPAGTPRRAG